MDYILDTTTAEYGQLMCDFFELLLGPIASLPLDAVLAVQDVSVFSFLGKSFGVGSWVRTGDSASLGLVGARIQSVYMVNNHLYMVLHVYPELQPDDDGALVLPDAAADPMLEIVPVDDVLYLSGMWSVSRSAADDASIFIESPV